MKSMAFGAVLATVIPVTCAAEDQMNIGYINAFYGMCLTQDFRVDLLRELAEQRDWEAVPLDMMERFNLGLWPGAEGWAVEWPEVAPPFIAIGASRGDDRPPAGELCAAFFPRGDGDYFIKSILSDAKATVTARHGLPDGGMAVTLSTPDLPGAVVDILFYPGETNQGMVAQVAFLLQP